MQPCISVSLSRILRLPDSYDAKIAKNLQPMDILDSNSVNILAELQTILQIFAIFAS